ncbi:MAG: type IX secretion system membrane protein PorP/SprF [Flavobacteriales bacterium]
MKKFIAISVLSAIILMSVSSHAQQISRRTQFAINTFMVNPAVAGTQNYSPFFASYRNQWAGFKGAPTTILASGHTGLAHGLGVGAILYNDNSGGAISESGAELTGAYRIDLNNYDAVSFGLSLNAAQYKFDNSLLVVQDPTDQALNGMQAESHMNFDATFGFLIFGEQYYAGFSIPQLFQSQLNLESEVQGGDNTNVRHFQLMGSYRYYINNTWDLQTSGFMRFTTYTPAQLDLNFRLNYNGAAWGGFTYRHKDAVAFMFGGIWNNFALGYSYDITMTDARVLSPHTHEILLGYYLERKSGKFRSNSLGPRRLDRGKVVN